MSTNGWAAIEAIATVAAALVAFAGVVVTILGVVVAGGGVLYAANQYKLDRLARGEAARAQAAAERAREEATWPYVVASPVVEFCTERTLALLVKNYGQTAAHNIKVTIPDRRLGVPLKRNTFSGGWTAQHELPLASTTLAPGQGFIESAQLTGVVEPGTLARVTVMVTYTDSNQRSHEQKYEVQFGEADRDGVRRPVVDALTGIERTLKRWTGDGRSLLVETVDEHDHRVFGSASPAPPDGTSPRSDSAP